ncbi:hypothetical protein L0657_18510 [Dyadobacter sp. CY345]|uniref:hypothetical protein n=1 Tax=Dyadobacter sp. CY345 TaxID=2909335 RepID=UPI001F47C747|nr:hypothetical protein [Dyadobacter sp. CY345]MCF2445958.1 hypothetical protein [Dyadobacter sp. CY345]
MSIRIFSTLPVVFASTLLHIGCCLLPVLSLVGTSLPFLNFFARYKPVFVWIQLAVMLYLILKIILDLSRIRSFCNTTDRVIHFGSLVIAVTGVLISHYEPFKNDNQKLAEQRFMLFKNHRQLEVGLSGKYDQEVLKKDLLEIKGVKSGRILIENDTLALTFLSNQTSSREILRNLRLKGYLVSD